MLKNKNLSTLFLFMQQSAVQYILYPNQFIDDIIVWICDTMHLRVRTRRMRKYG